jgi:uroporphyrinogen decarboxylase
MISRERIIKALNFEETEKIPYDLGATTVSGISRIAYENALKSKELSPEYENIDEYDPIQQIVQPVHSVKEILEIDTHRIGAQRLVGPESVATKNKEGTFHLTDQFGCHWEFDPKNDFYYNMTNSPLKKYGSIKEGLKKYQFPKVADTEEELIRVLDKQARSIAQQGVIADRNCAGITEVAFRIRGYEEFFMDMALDPDGASLLMEKILEYKLEYWSFFGGYVKTRELNEEILVAVECDDLGTQDSLLFSPEMIKALIMPLQKQLIKHIKKELPGVKVMFHSDGAIFDLIPDLIDMGVDILNPVQFTASGMDLPLLKKEFGKDIVFWGGGIDTQKTLPHGTPQQVADEVKKNIDILAPGGGFVFAAVHNIQADVPAENFWAMWNTVNNYY